MGKSTVAFLGLLAGVWLLLAGDDPGSWPAGTLAVGLAFLLHRGLGGGGGPGLHPGGLIRFIPYFLAQSVMGGTDVARRALSPSLPLDPEFIRYRTRLGGSGPRTVFLNVISLLPGTFSARMDEGELLIHTLADGERAVHRIQLLEEKVADLFGVGLAPETSSHTAGSEAGPEMGPEVGPGAEPEAGP